MKFCTLKVVMIVVSICITSCASTVPSNTAAEIEKLTQHCEHARTPGSEAYSLSAQTQRSFTIYNVAEVEIFFKNDSAQMTEPSQILMDGLVVEFANCPGLVLSIAPVGEVRVGGDVTLLVARSQSFQRLLNRSVTFGEYNEQFFKNDRVRLIIQSEKIYW